MMSIKRMNAKYDAVLIVILLSSVTVMVSTETASGYDKGVHQSMTQLYVGEVLKTKYPNSEPLQYIDTIAYGTWEEDEVDLVFGYGGDWATVSHFWDADNGPLDAVTLRGTGTKHWPNAWQKISYMNVGDYDPISPFGLWDQALLYYASGNKVYAYSLLGHIAHLIQDQSVPAHVHEDFHDDDVYEDTLNETWWSYGYQFVNKTELDKGLIDCSNMKVPGWRDDFSSLYYLLYTTNQRTDFFGSEGDVEQTGFAWGDGVDPISWTDYSDFAGYSLLGYYQTPGNMEYNFWVCNICLAPLCRVDAPCSWSCPNGHGWNVTEANAPTFISTQYLMPYAIRAAATMLEVFLKEVDKAAPTTTIGIGLNKYTSNNDVYISPDKTPFTLTATDDAAGVKVTGYRITGGGYDSDWKVYSAPFTFNQVQAGLADGNYTILYRSADSVNHLEADKSQKVYLTNRAADYRVSLSTGGLYLGIQVAIDAATAGSTIEVRPGTFQECVDFKGKAITLRSIGGPEVTTIDAGGGLHAVTFAKTESATTILDGFTITGGNASGVGLPNDSGAGILCSGTQPVIRNCIITNNYAAGQGGGIFMATMSPVLQNCLIYNNNANNGGGLLSFYSKPIIVNCTFATNVARGGLGGAIAAFANDYTNAPILRNCILWGNTPLGIACDFPLIITGCDVQNLHPVYYPYNLTCDPKFVDSANGNFRLKADSLCIGTGNNDVTYAGQTDLDGYSRILDGRCAGGTAVVDMGAYEFNYAYHGDLDTNCTVDLADLAMLVAAWMHEPVDRTIDIAPEAAGDWAVNIMDFAMIAEYWMEENP